jgi:hypothetical protein
MMEGVAAKEKERAEKVTRRREKRWDFLKGNIIKTRVAYDSSIAQKPLKNMRICGGMGISGKKKRFSFFGWSSTDAKWSVKRLFCKGF